MEVYLCFFAGTLDDDLMPPRLALLNASENRSFLDNLVATTDAAMDVKKTMTRKMMRQLLSGSHYRFAHDGERSDRDLVEQRYGIETRVDLLGGMHVKKAILASYLHECDQREIPLSINITGVLQTVR